MLLLIYRRLITDIEVRSLAFSFSQTLESQLRLNGLHDLSIENLIGVFDLRYADPLVGLVLREVRSRQGIVSNILSARPARRLPAACTAITIRKFLFGFMSITFLREIRLFVLHLRYRFIRDLKAPETCQNC